MKAFAMLLFLVCFSVPVYFSAPALAESRLRDFGAVGDGVADDSAAWWACLDAASAGDGRVELGTGVYKIEGSWNFTRNRLRSIPALRSIKGDGPENTVLLLKENSNGETKLILVAWKRDEDVDLELQGFTVDGNRERQNWQGGHDLPRQGGIFVTARNIWQVAGAGNVRLTVRDVTLQNSAGDGLHLAAQVKAYIERLKARTTFRGGFQMTSFDSEATLKDCDLGDAGCDIEPNVRNYTNRLYAYDTIVRGNYDVAMESTDSIAYFDRLRVLDWRTPCYLFNPGTYFAKDARFHLTVRGGNSKLSGLYVRMTGKMTFEDTTFLVRRASEINRSPIRLRTHHRWQNVPSTATFRRCRVIGDDDFEGPLIHRDPGVSVLLEDCVPAGRWTVWP